MIHLGNIGYGCSLVDPADIPECIILHGKHFHIVTAHSFILIPFTDTYQFLFDVNVYSDEGIQGNQGIQGIQGNQVIFDLQVYGTVKMRPHVTLGRRLRENCIYLYMFTQIREFREIREIREIREMKVINTYMCVCIYSTYELIISRFGNELYLGKDLHFVGKNMIAVGKKKCYDCTVLIEQYSHNTYLLPTAIIFFYMDGPEVMFTYILSVIVYIH
jgi:hypothetical protein